MKPSPGSMSSTPGRSSPPGLLNSNPWKSCRNQERQSLCQVCTHLSSQEERSSTLTSLCSRDGEIISTVMWPVSWNQNYSELFQEGKVCFEAVQSFNECPETYMACSIGLHLVQVTKQMGSELQHHKNVIQN